MSAINCTCFKCQLNRSDVSVLDEVGLLPDDNYGCKRCRKKRKIVSFLKDLQQDDEPIEGFLFQIINAFNLNNNNDEKQTENNITKKSDISLLFNENATRMCSKGHQLNTKDKHLKRGHCVICNTINGGIRNIRKTPNKNEIARFLNEYIQKDDIPTLPSEIQFGEHEKQKQMEAYFKKRKWDIKYKLHYASLIGDFREINILLKNTNSNQNAKMSEFSDYTSIMIAAQFDQLLSLITLIQYDFNPFPPPNKTNCTPYSLAVVSNNFSIVDFYKEYIKFIYGFQINKTLHLECWYCYQFDNYYNPKHTDYNMYKYTYCINCCKENAKRIKIQMTNNVIMQKQMKRIIKDNTSISVGTLTEMRDVTSLHWLLKEIISSGYIHCFSLWLINIDYFQDINTSLIHSMTNIKLQLVGSVLKRIELKTNDYWSENAIAVQRLWTFRLSRHEFGMVVEHGFKTEELRTLHKLYLLLGKEINKIELGKEIKVKTGLLTCTKIKSITVSIGVCLGDGMQGNSYKSMLQAADEATERVEYAGGHGVAIFEPFEKKTYSSFKLL